MFHNEELQVFGITVQNRFARGLCSPAVLVRPEWFSKRTEIIFITITNQDSIELVCIQAQIGNNCQGIDTFLNIKLFSPQLATGGIESAVYKKLIAPFKDDLPATKMDGFRRVCADHNYAYVSPDFSKTNFSLSLSCQLVPLPDTSYRSQWAFIISKNSSYKGLINWRWGNKIKSIR